MESSRNSLAGARSPEPPSSTLRWLVLGVGGALLALLVLAGFVAAHFLGEMRTRQLAATRALAERTQMLSGLWLSIQSSGPGRECFRVVLSRGREVCESSERQGERSPSKMSSSTAVGRATSSWSGQRDRDAAGSCCGSTAAEWSSVARPMTSALCARWRTT